MDLVSQQKTERRARILDAAHALIAERGYAAITVRELASRCGVSVPTLYNLFGGKDEVLAAAVETGFRSLLAELERTPGEPGLARVLAIVERCADETARLADYHRSLLRAFAEVRETEPLQDSLTSTLASALATELDAMKRQRQLASWVNAEVLAGQITAACISASVGWARGAVGDLGLRAAMIHATGLLLLGVSRGVAHAVVEEHTRSAQSVLERELKESAAAPRRNSA